MTVKFKWIGIYYYYYFFLFVVKNGLVGKNHLYASIIGYGLQWMRLSPLREAHVNCKEIRMCRGCNVESVRLF